MKIDFKKGDVVYHTGYPELKVRVLSLRGHTNELFTGRVLTRVVGAAEIGTESDRYMRKYFSKQPNFQLRIKSCLVDEGEEI